MQVSCYILASPFFYQFDFQKILKSFDALKNVINYLKQIHSES